MFDDPGHERRQHSLNVAWLSLSHEISGAEYSLLDAVRWSSSHSVVFCPRGELSEEVRRRGIPWYEVPGWAPTVRGGIVGALRQIPALWRAVRVIRGAIRESKVDIVAANGLRPAMALAFAGSRQVPTAWILRDFVPAGWTGRIARKLSGSSSRIVTSSDAVAEDVAHRWGLHRRPTVITPGVTWRPAEAGALRRELGIPQDVPLFAVVGQITPWKGQKEAIDAVRLARAQNPFLRLLIIGAAKFRQENLSYRIEIDHMSSEDRGLTQLLGERRDLERIYPDLTALMVPSHDEPFGRVAVEALGYGTRVIGYASGGLPGIVNSDTRGRLVPTGDVEALARAVQAEAAAPRRLPETEEEVVRNTYGGAGTAARWDELWHVLVAERGRK